MEEAGAVTAVNHFEGDGDMTIPFVWQGGSCMVKMTTEGHAPGQNDYYRRLKRW